MHFEASCGHIGCSLSCIDLLIAILKYMNQDDSFMQGVELVNNIVLRIPETIYTVADTIDCEGMDWSTSLSSIEP